MTAADAPGATTVGRRGVLLGLGATLAARRASATTLRLLVAPSTASVLVARAVAEMGAELAVWRSLDELRAAIVGGRVDAFTLPTNVAANLHARGLPVRLVNVISAGPMWLMTRDPELRGIADLRGRRVQLYFRNDLPDVALRWLLLRSGLEPERDVGLDYGGSAVEAAQLLLAGRATTALLNEPAASAALLTAAADGQVLHRAFTLQDAWAEISGDATPLPMAGLAVLDATPPAAVARLHRATLEAALWVRDDPAAAGRLAAERLGFRADATALALSEAAIRVDAAARIRPAIEAFLEALAELAPALIGGRLPPPDFYLDP